jgi:hypothetical protein
VERYSEIEAKFSAESVEPHQLLAFASEIKSDSVLKPYGYEISGAIIVKGYDVYYGQGKSVLRVRCDGEGDKATICITTKTRKSKADLLDRNEVDVWLRKDTRPEDIETFLDRTGWKALFTINKYYTVFHLKSSSGPGNIICLALYDTHDGNPENKKRFLEVEVERDSVCTSAQGRAILKKWISSVRARFGLGEPSNQSLFELYMPKK